MEEAGGYVCLVKVLPHGGIISVDIWGVYLGTVDYNGKETRGIAYGVTTAGDEYEGGKAEGRIL